MAVMEGIFFVFPVSPGRLGPLAIRRFG